MQTDKAILKNTYIVFPDMKNIRHRAVKCISLMKIIMRDLSKVRFLEF